MGTDIHLHIEIKINNEWHHYACPSISRDYYLFGKMAGIRVNNGPISEPKGISADISLITKLSLKEWESDAHSISWFDVVEIGILEDDLLNNTSQDLEYDILKGTYLFGNSFSGFKEYPEQYPEELQDVRFVFWFDN